MADSNEISGADFRLKTMLRAFIVFALWLAGGCAYTVRLSAGLTVDTIGSAGLQAGLSAGFGAPLGKRRPQALMLTDTLTGGVRSNPLAGVVMRTVGVDYLDHRAGHVVRLGLTGSVGALTSGHGGNLVWGAGLRLAFLEELRHEESVSALHIKGSEKGGAELRVPWRTTSQLGFELQAGYEEGGPPRRALFGFGLVWEKEGIATSR